MNMLNIGCGATYHSDWINIDLGMNSNVTSHDVIQGLPFPDNTFDIVYHSHLLEHISCENALSFMRECFRVLKPGGTTRILVPDLEMTAKLYLEKLSTASESESDYDWMMLELYDQSVRERSGGHMETYLRSYYKGLPPFVSTRMGSSALQYMSPQNGAPVHIKLTWRTLCHMIYRLRIELAKVVVRVLLGQTGKNSFDEGLFRSSGEVHRWMYDRFSLGRLMTAAGFIELTIVSPFESNIQDFVRYKLDVVDGVARKPNSLVVEAVKP
jgi:predicted SAM-dependent methyltransferase